ncbi:MAG TPA: MIP/aquaporin family protein [Rhizomicrobium sp.]|jgi:glycerol uptake facilitator-like aquaporin
MTRRLAAEALGTAFLLMAVIGSGIMGERLAGGNAAIALLANTLATGAALTVLISIFTPVSGAHFNPVVTLVSVLRGETNVTEGVAYAAVQVAAAIAGVWAAHLMFALPVFEVSGKLRDGPAQIFSEFVATFGLMMTIHGVKRSQVALMVGLYIAAAYWFTASTSFANPAVTIARMLSDSFAGIAPSSALLFVPAQIAGGLCGWLAWRRLRAERAPACSRARPPAPSRASGPW